jgi:hypothetical protein
VQRVAEERFNALDLQHTGKVAITPVRSFVKQMSPGATDQQVGCHGQAVSILSSLHDSWWDIGESQAEHTSAWLALGGTACYGLQNEDHKMGWFCIVARAY